MKVIVSVCKNVEVEISDKFKVLDTPIGASDNYIVPEMLVECINEAENAVNELGYKGDIMCIISAETFNLMVDT